MNFGRGQKVKWKIDDTFCIGRSLVAFFCLPEVFCGQKVCQLRFRHTSPDYTPLSPFGTSISLIDALGTSLLALSALATRAVRPSLVSSAALWLATVLLCCLTNFYQNCTLCHGYVWNKIISKLFQPSSTPVWNNFIWARGNLPEIISKLFRRIIAAHEYLE